MFFKIKKALKSAGVGSIVGETKKFLWQTKYLARRKFLAIDQSLVAAYGGTGGFKKLHIGCGENRLDDWLNSDFYPTATGVLHFDATQAFPLGSDTFDYVFSEHMIEHISHSDGLAMLTECFRVLKENGKVRISTPDLAFLLDLYAEKKSDLQQKYIDWATERFIPDAPYKSSVFVMNNFVRDWGHVFIYDEDVLRASMQAAGFVGVTRCELNKSDEEQLRDLENEARMPDGFLRLETVTLEGTKPSAV